MLLGKYTIVARGQCAVVAPLAPQLLVVGMQILPGNANLASPAVAPQHLFPELAVWFRIEPKRGPLGRIRFMRISQLPDAEKPAVVRSGETRRTVTWIARAPLDLRFRGSPAL
jgi:hypothetical protein